MPETVCINFAINVTPVICMGLVEVSPGVSRFPPPCNTCAFIQLQILVARATTMSEEREVAHVASQKR